MLVLHSLRRVTHLTTAVCISDGLLKYYTNFYLGFYFDLGSGFAYWVLLAAARLHDSLRFVADEYE